MNCCMRADCPDRHCEGRALALQLHESDGGHAVDNSRSAPLEMPAAAPARLAWWARVVRWRFILIVLFAVLAAAAQVFA